MASWHSIDTLDLTNTLQIKMYQERQKRDNQQKKENNVNRISDGDTEIDIRSPTAREMLELLTMVK